MQEVRTRYKQIKQGGNEPQYPPISYGRHLIEHLFNMSPTTEELHAQSWQEIHAWSQCCKVALTGWEAETLRRMSEAYAIWTRKGQDPQCVAPWQAVKLSQDAIKRNVMDIFRPLVKREKPKPAPAVSGGIPVAPRRKSKRAKRGG